MDDGAQQGLTQPQLVFAHTALEDDTLDGAFDRALNRIEMGRHVLRAENHVDRSARMQARPVTAPTSRSRHRRGDGREAILPDDHLPRKKFALPRKFATVRLSGWP